MSSWKAEDGGNIPAVRVLSIQPSNPTAICGVWCSMPLTMQDATVSAGTMALDSLSIFVIFGLVSFSEASRGVSVSGGKHTDTRMSRVYSSMERACANPLSANLDACRRSRGVQAKVSKCARVMDGVTVEGGR